ncbi:MAG: hypothetical protein KY476_16915 [Planctomycetes bacterium]|nr:hypothetical protein [Planctomycetota bacterium]
MPKHRPAVATLVVVLASAALVDARGQENQPIDADRLAAWRERAEKAYRESTERKPGALAGGDSVPVWRLRGWPLRLVEDELLKALDATSPESRLEAAEELIDRTGRRHRQRIQRALEKLAPEEDIPAARLAVLRLRLGEADALNEVRNWAVLGWKEPGIDVWWCPMHPYVRLPRKGTCPACEMALLEGAFRYSYSQREAQRIALTALADRKDQSVPAIVRSILVDDAEPYWRLHAACQWSRVAADEGLPHFRVFLEGPRDHPWGDALSLAAEELPQHFAYEFRAVLADESQEPYYRLQAIVGLIAAGQRDHLAQLRVMVKAAETDEQHLLLFPARFLGEYGEREDVELLGSLLDGKQKSEAAAALLRLIERLEQQ